MKKILLLFGGNTNEHEVSYMSAKAIYENVDKRKYTVDNCYLDKKNNFYSVENIKNIKKIYRIENIVEYLKNYDLVFNIIHGKTGEDGTIQGFLELLNIKYIGPDLESSIICFDKELTKIILDKENIPQVPYLCYKDKINFEEVKKLGYPVIVKPSRSGSSIGISVASNKKELEKAHKLALKTDNKIIIEKFLKARELECSILDYKGLYASSIGEITTTNTFYDYDTKYYSNKYKLMIPANIPNEISEKIKEYAKKAFTAVNAKTLSRIDFFYDEENNKIYLNEINTIPGFTSISMYPKLLMHDKYTFKNLLNTIIKNSLY